MRDGFADHGGNLPLGGMLGPGCDQVNGERRLTPCNGRSGPPSPSTTSPAATPQSTGLSNTFGAIVRPATAEESRGTVSIRNGGNR
jgi:hypothetical protein